MQLEQVVVMPVVGALTRSDGVFTEYVNACENTRGCELDFRVELERQGLP